MIITSLYGMSKPDPKFIKQHEKRVAAVIAEMGEKYLLAKPVEKVDQNGKH
jgi:hypothetical protein